MKHLNRSISKADMIKRLFVRHGSTSDNREWVVLLYKNGQITAFGRWGTTSEERKEFVVLGRRYGIVQKE